MNKETFEYVVVESGNEDSPHAEFTKQFLDPLYERAKSLLPVITRGPTGPLEDLYTTSILNLVLVEIFYAWITKTELSVEQQILQAEDAKPFVELAQRLEMNQPRMLLAFARACAIVSGGMLYKDWVHGLMDQKPKGGSN